MFSSGPTKKHCDFDIKSLGNFLKQRNHVSDQGIEKIKELSDKVRESLKIPHDYKIGFVNGSCTGALEAVFWNALGDRSVFVLDYGLFGKRWADDILLNIKMPGKRLDLSQIELIKKAASNNGSYNSSYDTSKGSELRVSEKEIEYETPIIYDNDFVFTMTETATGEKWFDKEFLRKVKGLRIADLTSAVFCEEIEWDFLDCAAFSFQKALGAEAGLGCIVMNPKGFRRVLEREKISNKSVCAKFPIPRFMKITENLFKNIMPNTPSFIVVEDIIQSINSFMKLGGIKNSIKECTNNRECLLKNICYLENVNKACLFDNESSDGGYAMNNIHTCNETIENNDNDVKNLKSEFIAKSGNELDTLRSIQQSNYVLCLKPSYKKWNYLSKNEKWNFINLVAEKLEGYDVLGIVGHSMSEPCFRFCTGPTIFVNKQYIKYFMQTFINVAEDKDIT
ncbi:hypothetical protein [Candidatus Nesciobacter abundans]|uniref:Phosphoserine transaminase n=1 Tax=Candidatus Nesciobacter abundans TaxID=2601668 RepID=A0A5C0UG69_9PROT|nr:hypothetical protein [Candidatus Nesciobacter abundans]QEK39058.1 hypothetical protein FZC36_01235 [Candidatus Nesciobacter abundans]